MTSGAPKTRSQAQSRPETFQVRFGMSERTLKRTQLEKAPNSLISTALLTKEVADGAETIEIPSKASRGAAPGFAAWQDGTDQLFHVSQLTCKRSMVLPEPPIHRTY